MKYDEFITRLKEFLESEKIGNEYVVIARGAMLIWGLIDETNDVDVAINNQIDKQYKKIDWIDNFQKYNPEDIVIIDEIRCTTLEKIYELKKELNRPKDQEDIKLLEQYLNQK